MPSFATPYPQRPFSTPHTHTLQVMQHPWVSGSAWMALAPDMSPLGSSRAVLEALPEFRDLVESMAHPLASYNAEEVAAVVFPEMADLQGGFWGGAGGMLGGGKAGIRLLRVCANVHAVHAACVHVPAVHITQPTGSRPLCSPPALPRRQQPQESWRRLPHTASRLTDGGHGRRQRGAARAEPPCRPPAQPWRGQCCDGDVGLPGRR